MAQLNASGIKRLLLCILLCEGTGIASSLLSGTSDNPWFDNLHKPSWNPPSFLFGPVWTLLYLLMGIALWLVWESAAGSLLKKRAYLFFGFQLFLNFCWSVFFFRFHLPALAFADIMLLWLMIMITMFRFAPISKPAAWLLLPYICWVSFAALLNYTIWMMNP